MSETPTRFRENFSQAAGTPWYGSFYPTAALGEGFSTSPPWVVPWRWAPSDGGRSMVTNGSGQLVPGTGSQRPSWRMTIPAGQTDAFDWVNMRVNITGDTEMLVGFHASPTFAYGIGNYTTGDSRSVYLRWGKTAGLRLVYAAGSNSALVVGSPWLWTRYHDLLTPGATPGWVEVGFRYRYVQPSIGSAFTVVDVRVDGVVLIQGMRTGSSGTVTGDIMGPPLVQLRQFTGSTIGSYAPGTPVLDWCDSWVPVGPVVSDRVPVLHQRRTDGRGAGGARYASNSSRFRRSSAGARLWQRGCP